MRACFRDSRWSISGKGNGEDQREFSMNVDKPTQAQPGNRIGSIGYFAMSATVFLINISDVDTYPAPVGFPCH
jgi:hypothetical protein